MDFPYPGIQVHQNTYGMTIVRLHYSADPNKTQVWAEKERQTMTDPAMFQQEYEIRFDATLGQRVFHQFDEEACLEQSRPIPQDWTRYFALDPHPGVPDASLWAAVDQHGELWVYREFWPSKIYGKPNRNIPEDDNPTPTRDYTEVIKWLELGVNDTSDFNTPRGKESQSGNPFNVNGSEHIYTRVIDYAARGFGSDKDNPEAMNFQKRYEKHMDELGLDNPRFDDAVKDLDVGIEAVNEWLKPRLVEDMSKPGNWLKKSKLHILKDKCPELIIQLRENRKERLSPLQAETKDPTGRPMKKRNHLTDCLRYIVMANPVYVGSSSPRSTWSPIYEGISY